MMVCCLLPVQVTPAIFPPLRVFFLCMWKRNEQLVQKLQVQTLSSREVPHSVDGSAALVSLVELLLLQLGVNPHISVRLRLCVLGCLTDCPEWD